MKFLVDICAASRSLVNLLEEFGHDILLSGDLNPSATDEALIELAYRENRILITLDNDFGRLVFESGFPAPCIVRLVPTNAADRLTAMRKLLDSDADKLIPGNIVVVGKDRVRIRARRLNDDRL